MRDAIVVCDYCRKSIDRWISIERAKFRISNGRMIQKKMGFLETTLENKDFCSVYCLEGYVLRQAGNESSFSQERDLWPIGSEPESEVEVSE